MTLRQGLDFVDKVFVQVSAGERMEKAPSPQPAGFG